MITLIMSGPFPYMSNLMFSNASLSFMPMSVHNFNSPCLLFTLTMVESLTIKHFAPTSLPTTFHYDSPAHTLLHKTGKLNASSVRLTIVFVPFFFTPVCPAPTGLRL